MTTMRTVLITLLVLFGSAADAAVLCSSPLGHVRLRETCRRHEQVVAVAQIGNTEAVVPLSNWALPGMNESSELASAAAASDSTMISVSPCRLVDTRPGLASALVNDDIGPFSSGELRTYGLTGNCDVPAGATALSINLAVVPGLASGFASVGPSGSFTANPPPNFSSINFVGGGPAISNSLIVPLNDMGQIDAYAASSADVIIDTNGYFLPKDHGTNEWFISGTGTPTENGSALLAAVTKVNLQSPSEHTVLRLGPGVFDTGSTALQVLRPVALVGAGRLATTITCACPTIGAVILNTATDSEVRDVGITNTSTAANGLGIRLMASSGSIVRAVQVTTSGGAGILVSSSDHLLEDVTIDAANAGVLVSGSGDPAHVEIRGSRIASSTREAVAMFGTDSVIVANSTLETASAFMATVGVSATGMIEVRHSTLIAPNNSYVGGTGGTFLMSHTLVDAQTSAFTGTASCSATTVPGGFHDTTCP